MESPRPPLARARKSKFGRLLAIGGASVALSSFALSPPPFTIQATATSLHCEPLAFCPADGNATYSCVHRDSRYPSESLPLLLHVRLNGPPVILGSVLNKNEEEELLRSYNWTTGHVFIALAYSSTGWDCKSLPQSFRVSPFTPSVDLGGRLQLRRLLVQPVQ